MTPQLPADGIATTMNYPDLKGYVIPCTCGDSNHEHTLLVSGDECDITVTIDTQTKTDVWSQLVTKKYDIENVVLQKWHWFWVSAVNAVYVKLRMTWKIWTQGYIESRADIMLSQQQATNYAHALLNAVNDVDTARQKMRQSKAPVDGPKESDAT